MTTKMSRSFSELGQIVVDTVYDWSSCVQGVEKALSLLVNAVDRNRSVDIVVSKSFDKVPSSRDGWTQRQTRGHRKTSSRRSKQQLKQCSRNKLQSSPLNGRDERPIRSTDWINWRVVLIVALLIRWIHLFSSHQSLLIGNQRSTIDGYRMLSSCHSSF